MSINYLCSIASFYSSIGKVDYICLRLNTIVMSTLVHNCKTKDNATAKEYSSVHAKLEFERTLVLTMNPGLIACFTNSVKTGKG